MPLMMEKLKPIQNFTEMFSDNLEMKIVIAETCEDTDFRIIVFYQN